jgi:hypothetical protein
MARALGVDLAANAERRDRHVSATRPAVDEVTDEERALIAEHNRMDAELYAYALERFEEAVGAAA